MRWHKIKPGRTCPVDTALFICLSDYSMSVARYSSKLEAWVCNDKRTELAVVTHWAYIKRPPLQTRYHAKRKFYESARKVLNSEIIRIAEIKTRKSEVEKDG